MALVHTPTSIAAFLNARKLLLEAARQAAAGGRAEDLARAAIAIGGGLAGFEVPLQDEEQADLLRAADATLPPEAVALRAAVRGRLSLALAGSISEADRAEMALDAVRLAKAAGDRRIESAVLAAYCDAIAGPDYIAERTEAATRMLSLASGLPEPSLPIARQRAIGSSAAASGAPGAGRPGRGGAAGGRVRAGSAPPRPSR